MIFLCPPGTSGFFLGYLHKTKDSRLKTQDFKLKTQDSRLQTQDSRLQTQNFKLKTQDSRVRPPDFTFSKHAMNAATSCISCSCVLLVSTSQQDAGCTPPINIPAANIN